MRLQVRISSRILIRHKQEQTKYLVIIMHLSLHHIMYNDAVVGVSILFGRNLLQCVLLKISLLSLYNFFIFSMSSKSKLIAVSEKTYHDLAADGNFRR